MSATAKEIITKELESKMAETQRRIAANRVAIKKLADEQVRLKAGRAQLGTVLRERAPIRVDRGMRRVLDRMVDASITLVKIDGKYEAAVKFLRPGEAQRTIVLHKAETLDGAITGAVTQAWNLARLR